MNQLGYSVCCLAVDHTRHLLSFEEGPRDETEDRDCAIPRKQERVGTAKHIQYIYNEAESAFLFVYSSSVNKTRSSRARFLAVTRELLINITVIFKDFLDRPNFDHLLSSVSEKDEDISNKNGFSK